MFIYVQQKTRLSGLNLGSPDRGYKKFNMSKRRVMRE